MAPVTCAIPRAAWRIARDPARCRRCRDISARSPPRGTRPWREGAGSACWSAGRPPRAGLGHAAPDIAETNAAEQRVVALAENEKTVALVGPPIRRVAGDAAAERGTGQRVGRPSRLPGGEKASRVAAQRRPFLPVTALGRAQPDARATDAQRRRLQVEEARQLQEIGGRSSRRCAPSGQSAH